MMCRMCESKDKCTKLCPPAERYVNQGTAPLKELRMKDYSPYFFIRTNIKHFAGEKYNENELYDLIKNRELPGCQTLDSIDKISGVRIPRRQWECIRLFYFEGLDITEIAQLLRIRPITVKVLRLRGMKRLALQLGVPYRKSRLFKSSKQNLILQKSNFSKN